MCSVDTILNPRPTSPHVLIKVVTSVRHNSSPGPPRVPTALPLIFNRAKQSRDCFRRSSSVLTTYNQAACESVASPVDELGRIPPCPGRASWLSAAFYSVISVIGWLNQSVSITLSKRSISILDCSSTLAERSD